jgi:rubrerythrin
MISRVSNFLKEWIMRRQKTTPPRQMDPAKKPAAAVSRRTFLSSAAATPVVAAAACIGGTEAFSWADQVAPEAAAKADNLLTERLHTEFSEECQASLRYEAFAGKAKEQGMPNIAKLFRAASQAEKIHMTTLLSVMGAIRETALNLKASAAFEDFLLVNVLPTSVKQAEQDKNPAAATALTRFIGACGSHRDVFTRGLASAKAGTDMADTAMYVCPTCGAVILGASADTCPVCMTPKSKFITPT